MYIEIDWNHRIVKLYAMRVEKNCYTSPPLSRIKVDDYMVAVNGISLSSFMDSLSHSEWDARLNTFTGPKLICFFRKDDLGQSTYIPSQV